MKKAGLLFLMTAALILVSVSALADGTLLRSGSCGDNVSWRVLKSSDGVLTLEVSGTGPMTQSVSPGIENISRIIVNSGVTSICEYAFLSYEFAFVQEISVPASCTTIGERAFFSDNLRTLTLAQGVKTLGAYAFFPSGGAPHAYCVAVIPTSVTQIGEGALDDLIPAVYPNSTALTYCINNGIKYILLNSTGSNSHRMALLKAVAQVEDVPLRYRSQVVSILQTMTLTNSQCDSLRSYVLEEEKALKRAMLDNSMSTGEITGFLQRFISRMKTVGVQISYEIAFFNGFPGVKLTATVNGKQTKVDIYRTEYHVWTVKNVTPSVKNGYLYVETDEGMIITGYSGSSKVLNFPASINNIPVVSIVNTNDSFPDGITSITIPNGVKTIGPNAFRNQGELKTLNLPNSLESIGNSAFADCYGLTAVTIPDGVTCIDDWAFIWCYNLTTVTIPRSVTRIGNGAFCGCGLTEIFYGGTEEEWNNISIGYENDSLEDATLYCLVEPDLVLPASLTVIESKAFVNLPEGLVIFVPATVKSIAGDAFDNGVIILTPAGSYASSWAASHGFECIEN